MKNIFFIFITIFASTGLTAGFTGDFKITEIHVLDARGFMVLGNFPKTECSHSGGALFIEATSTQYKHYLAVAMMSKALGNSINIYFNDCQTVGFYVTPDIKFPAIIGGGGNFILREK